MPTVKELREQMAQMEAQANWQEAMNFLDAFYPPSALILDLEVEGQYDDEGGTDYHISSFKVQDANESEAIPLPILHTGAQAAFWISHQWWDQYKQSPEDVERHEGYWADFAHDFSAEALQEREDFEEILDEALRELLNEAFNVEKDDRYSLRFDRRKPPMPSSEAQVSGNEVGVLCPDDVSEGQTEELTVTGTQSFQLDGPLVFAPTYTNPIIETCIMEYLGTPSSLARINNKLSEGWQYDSSIVAEGVSLFVLNRVVGPDLF